MFNPEIRLSGTVGQLKAASNILNNDSLCLLLFYWVRNYKKQIQGMNDSNLLTKPYTRTRLQIKTPTKIQLFPSFHASRSRIASLHKQEASKKRRDERSDAAMCGIAVFVWVLEAIWRRRGWFYTSTQETKQTHQKYLASSHTKPRTLFFSFPF